MIKTPVQAEKDDDIISLILSGQTSFFEKLIRRYNPALYKVGRAYGFLHHDTEDLMQDTFINAYSNIASFEKRSSFRTWLTRIMINNCYHKKKKSESRQETLSDAPFQPTTAALFQYPVNTERTIMNKELGLVIEQALHQIPEDYRIVFTLRELNGCSVEETVNTLNISESNVKTRLSRAKLMLRKQIEKTYSPEEIFEFNLVYCDSMVHKVMSKIGEMANSHINE